MNIRYVISRLGILFIVLSTIMGIVAAAYFIAQSILNNDVDPDAGEAFLISGLTGAVPGLVLWFANRSGSRIMGRREALLLVAASWTFGAIICALPFFVWAQLSEAVAAGQFRSFVNCYFEAMSGLTTTGATVLGDIENIPHSLLFWRAMTHWLGGLGIVVLFVAVLPSLGVGGKKLFRVEAPGPNPEGLQPRIVEAARVLGLIYLVLTVLEVAALRIAGMGYFDAICHTFATLATGGYSTRNASLGAYADKPAIDIIAVVFMVLAGANFGLYYQLLRGRATAVWKDPEMRLYLVLLTAGSVLVWWSLTASPDPILMTDGTSVVSDSGTSLRQSIVTTVSIQTTTGFCTSDFNHWPFVAQAVLIMLMFVGGCSGSTAGGFKVIRLWIAFKVMIAEIEYAFRPNVIRPVRVGGSAISDELKLGTIAYVLGVVILFVVGSGAIMVFEQLNPTVDCTYTSAATASIATLCTIGPGLDQVGAVANYGWFTGPSKAVMCVLMLLGRLEVFAIIVLLTPRFWRGD